MQRDNRLRINACAFVAFTALFVAVVASAQNAPRRRAPEPQVKAAFLYNFARFVSWPATAFASPESPIRIGVQDMTPFGDAFDLILAKKAQGRNVEVVECRRYEDMRTCHIVLLNAADHLLIKGAIQELRDAPILTVSDTDGFTTWGGVMAMVARHHRLALIINRAAARRAGLRLSAQLLEVAEAIEDNNEGGP